MAKSVRAAAPGIAVLLVVVGLTVPGSPLRAAPEAKVTAVVLNVTHCTGAEGDFAKSKVGTLLPVNSRVRTGPRSKCEIKFPNGTVVRMAARSDLVITSVTERKVKLLSGEVLANVVKGSGAQIEGAVATAAVRGTLMLFRGATLPGEYPPRDFEQLSVWDGIADFSSAVGSSRVGHQQMARIGPTGELTLPMIGWPMAFPTGAPTPWWSAVQPGTNVQATPGTKVGTEFKQKTVSTGQQQATTVVLAPPSTGGLEVVVQGGPSARAIPPTRSNPVGLMLLAAAPAAFGGSFADQPASAFGRKFYGPRSQVDLFGLLYTGGSYTGIRTRASGIWGDNLYIEIGGQATSEFEGDWHTQLSEGFGLWRHSQFDLVAGRQHYLESPVNNSTLGSLFSYTTFDGARLHHDSGTFTADLAWVDSYDREIVDRGEGRGALARVGGPLLGAQVGVNCFHENGEGTGVSADLAYPLIPGYLDVYGEFGDDPSHRHLETWGTYFPGMYQTLGLDLFIERAQRSGHGAMWSATAYQGMRNGWTGLCAARRIQGGNWEGAVGVFKRFGSLD